MYTYFYVEKYSNIGDGLWSGTPETITNIYDVQVNQSIEDTKDTFNFKINNTGKQDTWTVKPLDKVNIYYIINGELASSNNLIMTGLARKVTGDLQSKGKLFRIEGVGYSDILTNAIVFYDPGTATTSVSQFINGCLDSIKLMNPKFQVTWNASNPTISATLSTSTSKVREYNKTFTSILDKYLKAKYTLDGDYFWYVNNSNELCIRKKGTGTSVTNLIEGIDFQVIKTSINADDVKNYIIVKCGTDLNNNPISTRYDDVASRAKHGFRYHMIVDVGIAEKIKKANSTWTNDQVIAKAKEEGYAMGESYAKMHNKGYLSISCQLKPTTSYSVGDRIQVTIPSYPDFNKRSIDSINTLNKYNVRIESIQYNIDGILLTLVEEPAA